MWKDDCKEGEGTMTYSDGDKYVGMWKDDCKEGEGTYTWKNGNKYVGMWKDDCREGEGTQTNPDGAKYIGMWKDDCRKGEGTQTYSNGAKYVGIWKNGKYHGEGTYTYPDGAKYVGMWKNDKKEGEGMMTDSDGKYFGMWKNNLYDGHGTSICKYGKILGIYKEGKLIKGNKIIQSYSENIKIRLLIEKSFVKKIFVNYFDISYELDCKTKFKNKNVSSIYWNEKKVRITNFDFKMSDDIIMFCKKLIESSTKIQKYVRGFMCRLKIKNSNATKIQKYARGFIIRNIFYKCNNYKNTSCPFNKIRKMGYEIRKKIIYIKKYEKCNIDKKFDDNVNLNISNDFVKIPSPKRRNNSKFNRKNGNVNNSVSKGSVNNKKKGVVNICKRGSKKKKKKYIQSEFIENNHIKNICDGDSVIRFKNGTYQVRNNQTGVYVLYDQYRQPIQIYEQKCLVKSEYIKNFLQKKSIIEENYRYLDCHGLTKEQLGFEILRIIDSKSTIINSIILNIGKGYHKNKDGIRLILKKYLYELQDRFITSNINTDPFFCNYPEGFNFSIKNVHFKNIQQTKIEQLLCLYVN